MRELILKDIKAMGRTLKIYTLFLSAYLVLALVGLFNLEVAVAMLHLIIMMIPIGGYSVGAIEFDGQKHADYKNLVGARYLAVLLAALISSTLGLVIGVFLEIVGGGKGAEYLSVAFLSIGAGLTIAGFFLPLRCKLGEERARPYLYAAALLPMLGLFGVFRLGFWEDFAWSERGAVRFSLLLMMFALAGFGISFLIFCRTMKREEIKKERQF